VSLGRGFFRGQRVAAGDGPETFKGACSEARLGSWLPGGGTGAGEAARGL